MLLHYIIMSFYIGYKNNKIYWFDLITDNVFIPQVWQINNIQSYNKVNFICYISKKKQQSLE